MRSRTTSRSASSTIVCAQTCFLVDSQKMQQQHLEAERQWVKVLLLFYADALEFILSFLDDIKINSLDLILVLTTLREYRGRISDKHIRYDMALTKMRYEYTAQRVHHYDDVDELAPTEMVELQRFIYTLEASEQRNLLTFCVKVCQALAADSVFIEGLRVPMADSERVLLLRYMDSIASSTCREFDLLFKHDDDKVEHEFLSLQTMYIDDQLCTALGGMALNDALSSEEILCNNKRFSGQQAMHATPVPNCTDTLIADRLPLYGESLFANSGARNEIGCNSSDTVRGRMGLMGIQLLPRMDAVFGEMDNSKSPHDSLFESVSNSLSCHLHFKSDDYVVSVLQTMTSSITTNRAPSTRTGTFGFVSPHRRCG